MIYKVEILFVPDSNISEKIDNLIHYADMLSAQSPIGKGVEHESSHYVEYTYYKWKYDDIDIKLYWGDDDATENKLILSIVSFGKDVSSLGDELHRCIGNNVSDMKVNYFEKAAAASP